MSLRFFLLACLLCVEKCFIVRIVRALARGSRLLLRQGKSKCRVHNSIPVLCHFEEYCCRKFPILKKHSGLHFSKLTVLAQEGFRFHLRHPSRLLYIGPSHAQHIPLQYCTIPVCTRFMYQDSGETARRSNRGCARLVSRPPFFRGRNFHISHSATRCLQCSAVPTDRPIQIAEHLPLFLRHRQCTGLYHLHHPEQTCKVRPGFFFQSPSCLRRRNSRGK